MVEAAKVITPDTPIAVHAAKIVTPPSVAPPVTPAVASVSTCTPFGVVPAPSELAMTTPGLQQLVDTPTTYTVHGTTSGDISNQLRRCAPSNSEGTFSGTTSYWLGTRYSYRLTPTATCQLTDITVAVHVTQVLPRWQDSAGSAIATKWEIFERNLVLHENGHTAIDIAQAQTLLSELAAMPDMPCDTIAGAANTITANRLAALDRANDNYDAATNHGASQGAIW
jgi:predicted secreted Zn-dependent protease